MQAAAARRWLLPCVALTLAQGCNSNNGNNSNNASVRGAAQRAAQGAAASRAQPSVPLRPDAAHLQAWLQSLAATPTMDAAQFAAQLQASQATWNATIIAPFTGCRAASELALVDATSVLWPALHATPPPKITVRKHYAGDAGLPAGAAHLRWALPVLFDSYVVALDDKTVDLVFWPVLDSAGWRWLAAGNIDAALTQAITQGTTETNATRCAELVVASHHNERCLQLAAAVVLAALHNDRNATTHACALADVHCTEGR